MKYVTCKGSCNTDDYAEFLIIKNETVATYKTLSFIQIIFKVYWLSGLSNSMYTNTYAICNSSNDTKIEVSLLDTINETDYKKNSIAIVEQPNGDLSLYIKRSKDKYGIACIELLNDYDYVIPNPNLVFNTKLSDLNNPSFESTPNLITKKIFYKQTENGAIGYMKIGNIITVKGTNILSSATEKTILNIGSENANTATTYAIGKCTSNKKNIILSVKIQSNGDIIVSSDESASYGTFCVTYIIE